jgi:23S rRNA (uracil1939-C5)-methyltransferase
MTQSLHVSALGALGDGIVHLEGGKTLYVPGSAPGDQVMLDAQGRLQAVLPGPERAEPLCPHFIKPESLNPKGSTAGCGGPSCGGCQLQHIRTASYQHWLGVRIAQALAQHGLQAPCLPACVSPPHSRRRVAWRALKSGKRLVLGFSAAQSHSLIDVQSCPVTHPDLMALMPALRGLLADILKDRQAVRVSATRTDTGIDLLIGDLSKLGIEARMQLADFAQAQKLARLSVEGPSGIELVAEHAPPSVQLGGVFVGVPAAAFLQATREGEQALITAVVKAVGSAKHVADLFCGLGTFALPLSQSARVLAIDAAGPLTQALKRASALAQRALVVEHRDLFRRPLDVQALNAFDSVVFDPPRAGALAQAEMLAKSQVPRVVAVSCNPNSFARDAEILCERGYQLDWIQPVGQFLWSTHVELVAQFSRA